MTRLRLFRSVVLLSVSFLMMSVALAADGIRGSFTATRKLQVDQITVAFEQTDHYGSDDAADRSDPGRIMIDAFKAAGLHVVAYRSVVPGLQPGMNTALFNKATIGSRAPAGYELRRSHAFTLAGFKQPEAVLHVLAKNGIRQTQYFRLENSNFETVRSELANEAIDGALLKARDLAKRLGNPDTEIADVVVVGAAPFMPTNSGGGQQSFNFGTLPADSLVEMSSLEATEPILVIKVAATVTLRPKRSAP
jgi:Protein of unknown function (DUF541)